MNKQEFYYPSADGITNIHASKWLPEGEPKAVLQIVHGMTEYAGRYDAFADFLTQHGYLVVAEDHLGHGLSVHDKSYYGYFGDNGNEWVIQDIHHLRKETQAENPNIPYMMLGHSMGSFLVRQYITEGDAAYADGLSGVIVMGTGWQPAAILAMGKAVAGSLGTRTREKQSKLLEMMAFGTYLSKIDNPQSSKDWLTKDRAIIDKYRKDPLCMFHFTPNAFYHMFRGMQKAHDLKRMQKLPEGLPILFASGAEDPVGNWGEAVRKAYMVYTDNTKCDVQIKLYLDDRHEILNETDKDQVWADMLEFLDGCIK